MDRSRLSNIISTTRLLPHFSAKNVDVMRSCILNQFECENESQFLCKVLKSLYKTLSIESTSIIREKAVQIADSQHVTRSEDGNHITVHKHIQQQYNDILSRLHSDIIDYFGTFLDKQESIEFGYLNKQLYIETQKHSYLMKRCNDKCLDLNDNHLYKMISNESDGFDYCFLKEMSLSINKKINISEITSFNNFFCRLSSLTCYTFLSLSHVPVDVLFNSRHNFYQDTTARHTLNVLRVQHHSGRITQKCMNQVDIFRNNLEHYQNNLGMKSMGNVGELQLSIPTHYWYADELLRSHKAMVRKLLCNCSCIAQSIHLLCDTKTTIDNIKQLKSTFHNNLTCCKLDRDASLIIDCPPLKDKILKLVC